MRRPPSAVAVPALLAALLLPAESRAQRFDDFRIPDHRVLSWTASLDGSAARHRISAGFGWQSTVIDVAGSAATALGWLTDSDPLRLALGFAVGAQGTRRGLKESYREPRPTGSPDEQVGDRDDRRMREFWAAEFEMRHQPGAVPASGFVRAVSSGSLSQAWAVQSAEIRGPGAALQRDELHAEAHASQMISTVTAAAGAGRVRDATPVMDALILERRLAASGTLSRPLSRAARDRLAALLALRPGFATVTDRPARRLWRQIELLLVEDGALRGAAGADEVQRAGEAVFPRLEREADALPRSPIQRLAGFFAGPAVELQSREWTHRDERGDRTTQWSGDSLVSSRDTTRRDRVASHEDRVWVGLELELHRPLGAAWQLDAVAAPRIPVDDDESGVWIRSAASLSFFSLDRWLIASHLTHERIENGAVNRADRWSVGFGGEVRYFIEDRLQLRVTASEQQYRASTPDGWSSSFQRERRIAVGIGTRLMGRLTARDLIAPVRTP